MRRSALFITALGFISVFAIYCVYVSRVLGDDPTAKLPKIDFLEEIPLPKDKNEDARVLFVGDVHGQYHEMIQLFEKTTLKNTTVVLLGDFLAKGPESVGVADFILEHSDQVKCALGNHDLAVMFAFLNPGVVKFSLSRRFGNLTPLEFTTHERFIPDDIKKIKPMHLEVARQLGPRKLFALAKQCSAAIHLDFGEEEVYAVHAGLLPGDLKKRIPSIKELTNMKYVDKDNWSKYSKDKKNDNFIRWFKLWKDSKLPGEFSSIKVLYGHDAAKGLNVKSHTIGLDSGCVKGGELSAMEFARKSGLVTTKLHQVKCGGRRREFLAHQSKSQSRESTAGKPDQLNSLVHSKGSQSTAPRPDSYGEKAHPKQESKSAKLKAGESAGREQPSPSVPHTSEEDQGVKVLMPVQQTGPQKGESHNEAEGHVAQSAS